MISRHFTMHDEILTPEAVALLSSLKSFENFYLAGGTALALQIGHRRSVDFDLFSQNPLPEQLLTHAKRTLAPQSVIVTYRSPEQLNLTVGDVKITFLYFSYPVIDPLVKYEGLQLISVREIASMKAFAIGKRLSYKDYIDWYFLLKERHVELADVIDHAKQKFGNDLNDRLFLGQLVSLAEVPTQKIDFLRDEVDRETITKFLETTVREFKI